MLTWWSYFTELKTLLICSVSSCLFNTASFTYTDADSRPVSALSVQTDTAVCLEAWGVGHPGPWVTGGGSRFRQVILITNRKLPSAVHGKMYDLTFGVELRHVMSWPKPRGYRANLVTLQLLCCLPIGYRLLLLFLSPPSVEEAELRRNRFTARH